MLQYQYSREIVPATVAKSRSFTSFPVRIHKHDSLAQKASIAFVKEYKNVCGSRLFDSNASQSPIGHFTSLVIPECHPERLALAVKILDLGAIEDDVIELPKSAEEREARYTEAVSDGDDWKSKSRYKRFRAYLSLEAYEAYGERAKTLGDLTKKFMEANIVGAADCMTYEEYIPVRIQSFGWEALTELACASMDIHLSTEEKATAYPAVRPLQVAMVLTNDYFSYAKEKALHQLQNRPGTISSAVVVLMKENNMSEDEARSLLKKKILEAEDLHRVELERLEQSGSLPQNVGRYVMVCRMACAGSHFWHATAPRFSNIAPSSNIRLKRSIVSRLWNWMIPTSGATVLSA
ncbi:hypothetical protein AJ79_08168 [Helicocarpus griseus UAMH5409]|uniref:Terpene synthase n=1 Tax=Helicocarpus griseus UAMH5409 TaxID=1447875 RepID=A0A2B7WV67_9EURO|nr:hypothetical protein AJ79_08168 [Helicocarpus griseus UAMH5409]